MIMKNIFGKFISALAIVGLGFSLAGCVEEMPDVNEELSFDRCLTPIESKVSVSQKDGQSVTFTWAQSKNAAQYVIEVFKGAKDAEPANVFEGTPAYTFNTEKSPLTEKLESDCFFFARVKAQNPEAGLEDSKWLSFPYPIGTYEVKTLVEASVLDRTANSIKLGWKSPDSEGINEIRVSPNPDGDGAEFKAVAVPAGSDEFEVTGLAPSVKYTFKLHFKSANRGEVMAWTRPSYEGAVSAATSEALIQALKDGASVIELTNLETPYELYNLVDGAKNPVEIGAAGALSIYGRCAVDGTKPVVNGLMNIPSLTSFHAEGIKFTGSGEFGRAFELVGADEAKGMDSFTVINCDFADYKSGFFYINSYKGPSIGTVKFDNIMTTDILGDGGDGFDIRTATQIGEISITNSTFDDGYRTFIRIDKAPMGTFTFAQNTLNNLCYADNGNNKGVFSIRGEAAAINITKNLFLNMNGSETRGNFFYTNSADKGFDATSVTTFAGNFFYNLGPAFWKAAGDVTKDGPVTEAAAVGGGGKVIAADPCENSEEGIFNLLKTSEAYANGVGDPRWNENYVPVIEDVNLATALAAVDYGKVWTLNDTKAFGKVVNKHTIKGDLRFFVNAAPFNVLENGLEFTAAGTTDANGVPVDGAVAFKVTGPGSVILSVAKSEAGAADDHLTVAVGSVDGKTSAVKGAAYVGADKAKIAFPDLNEGEETIVYLYGCGPLVLTAMQWTDDVNTGGPAFLATPVLTIDNPVVDDAFAGDVTVSWEEVKKAASYNVAVSFNNGEPSVKNVKDTKYVMTPSKMEPGSYSITVQAIKAETDMSSENSEVSEAVVFTLKETLKQISGSNPTVWDDPYFRALIAAKGTGDVTEEFISGNLRYITGGGKFKFGENEDTFDGVKAKYARVQLGGTGKPGEKACLEFIAPGAGKLTVAAIAGGDETEKPRVLAAAVGTAEIGTKDMPLSRSEGHVVAEFDCSSAVAGDLIHIYSKNKGINIFQIIWTPLAFDPDAGIPADETAINENYITDYKNDADMRTIAAGETVTINKVTYGGHAEKTMDFDQSGGRLKFGGASVVGEDGVPTQRYASFKITKPGTVTYKLVTSSGGKENERLANVILVKTVDGAQVVETLYSGPSAAKSSSPSSTCEITKEMLSDTKQTVTLYFFATGGALNLHELGFTPAE